MKIVTIIGARPQFIKAAIVSKSIKEHSDIEEILIHTGQHYDKNMSDIFFEQCGIPSPNYLLEINNASHAEMTGRMLIEIEKILIDEKPDQVMVYGDTNSTLAGALSAAKLHIPVIHVEAGLRSFNRAMPEEINRILTDHLSSILFCPTDHAVNNLKNEGFNDKPDVYVANIGDVMQDSAQFFLSKSIKPINFPGTIADNLFCLCTLHRAENTDNLINLTSIVKAINFIHTNICPVLIPIHPRTKAALQKHHLILQAHQIEPVGYLEMLWLLDKTKFVMTDSGGLQKEAFFLAKPCVTMRHETEWVELVQAGVNRLTGTNTDNIIVAAREAMLKPVIGNFNFYGDGNASGKIVEYLKIMT